MKEGFWYKISLTVVPFFVPSDIEAEGLEEYRLELERRLNDLYTRAWALQGKKEH